MLRNLSAGIPSVEVCTDSPDTSDRPPSLACVVLIRRMRGSFNFQGRPRRRVIVAATARPRHSVSRTRGFLSDGVYNHQREISGRTCPLKTVRRTDFSGQSVRVYEAYDKFLVAAYRHSSPGYTLTHTDLKHK